MKTCLIGCALILFSGCGSIQDSSNEDPRNTAQSCPASATPTFHEVILDPGKPIPQKVALVLEGELKFDECLEQPVVPMPPISRVERTQNNLLTVTVRHFGAYPSLPKDVSFEVLNRGNCAEQAQAFANVSHLPLEFKTEYPHGKECGGNTSAKVALIFEN